MSPNPPQRSSGDRLDILVVRFGSLGDLCLLAWALASLADRPGAQNRRITLVTKAAFAPLLQHGRGIDRVVALPGSGAGDVFRLAQDLRQTSWDMVIDAHNILRSHLLLGLMGKRPQRRLAKDTASRLAFLGFGHRGKGLGRTMRDRFEELTTGLAPAGDDTSSTLPPLASLAHAPDDPPTSEILGLGPGAQWATKRWPEDHFVTLLNLCLASHTGIVRIFIGPREESWFAGGPLERAAVDSGRTEIIRGRPLPEIAALLSACGLLVTNDSGLLHVAEAVGTPVVALFGPTTREFGYFPTLIGSRVLEHPLDCRPCSRNGKRPCHRGDLACLRDIPPAEVHAALKDMEVDQ